MSRLGKFGELMRAEDIPWADTIAPELPERRPGDGKTVGSSALQRQVAERVEGFAKLGIAALARSLPPERASAMARVLGPLAYRHYRRRPLGVGLRRAVAFLAPKNGADAQELERRCAAWFCNAARAKLEVNGLAALAGPSRLSLSGGEILRALAARNQSVIIVSVHTGTWELLGPVVSQHMPMIAPYQPQRDRTENRVLAAVRRRSGVKALPPSPTLARRLLAVLRAPGQALVLMVDELCDNAVRFPLFGRSVHRRGNLRFALRAAALTGAPIVPVTIGRTAPGRHHITCLAPRTVGTGDEEGAAQWLDEVFAPHVRERLEEWYMLHDLKV